MKTIYEIQSANPGPSVAIFGGVHGNEEVGVRAVRQLADSLKLEKGTVYLVLANPEAIAAGVRQITKNLNRCFFADNTGQTYEDIRARELMKVLDGCEALLDIHSFNDPSGEPFVICEPNALEIVKQFDVPLISTNWTEVEPGGADGYMFEQGKIGICIECGPANLAREYLPLALKSVDAFLAHFGMITAPRSSSGVSQRVIVAKRAFIRDAADFTLDKQLKSFQRLTEGQIYGSQNGVELVSGKDECIIFPRPEAKIGAEAFVIGAELHS